MAENTSGALKGGILHRGSARMARNVGGYARTYLASWKTSCRGVEPRRISPLNNISFASHSAAGRQHHRLVALMENMI